MGRRYGSVLALEDCSLDVAPGEIMALVGPNGAGKTTLSRIVAGFVAPSEGVVTVGGESPGQYRELHGLGYLPEEATPNRVLRVREFLEIRESIRGSRGEQIVEGLGVAGLLGKKLAAISKGQWRRTLIAYAMLSEPQLVILDEPESGLDPHALDRAYAIIRGAASRGATVLVSTHQLKQVESICDRMVFLQRGRIVGIVGKEDLGRMSADEHYRLRVSAEC